MDKNQKIIGIGFHRTGTRSLCKFMNELGFRSIHWPATICNVDYLALIEPVRDRRDLVVQALGPLIDPISRHSGRVFAEYRFTIVIALHKAYAFTTAKINSRPNLHRKELLPGDTRQRRNPKYRTESSPFQVAK